MQGPQNLDIRYAFDGDAWREKNRSKSKKQDVLGEISKSFPLVIPREVNHLTSQKVINYTDTLEPVDLLKFSMFILYLFN